MTERTCPTCGATPAEDDRVCQACGTLLRSADAGEGPPPHVPSFVHAPMFTGAPPDARPVAPPPPVVVAPPPVVIPPPRRLSGGDRSVVGCALVLVVVAALIVGAVLVVRHRQAPDHPAPLNTTNRTLVTADDVRFSMDGRVRDDDPQVEFGSSADGVFGWWTTEHAGWQEWVGIYRLNGPQPDAVGRYELSGDELAKALFDQGTIDHQRDETIDGRAATWYEGSSGTLRGGRLVSGKRVDDASLKYLITTFDERNLIIIGLAWDPKHPPPTREIEEIRSSFRVRN